MNYTHTKKVGKSQYNIVVSGNTAQFAEILINPDGTGRLLHHTIGPESIVASEFIRQTREHEGWLQFYEPYPDLPTADHVTGYNEAEREYHALIDAERMECRDQEYIWQY